MTLFVNEPDLICLHTFNGIYIEKEEKQVIGKRAFHLYKVSILYLRLYNSCEFLNLQSKMIGAKLSQKLFFCLQRIWFSAEHEKQLSLKKNKKVTIRRIIATIDIRTNGTKTFSNNWYILNLLKENDKSSSLKLQDCMNIRMIRLNTSASNIIMSASQLNTDSSAQEASTYNNSYEYSYDYNASVNNLPLDEFIPVALIYGLVYVFGLFGNVLVIFTILKYRHMRNTTNVFLLSLSSADLLVVLICVPVKVSEKILLCFF